LLEERYTKAKDKSWKYFWAEEIHFKDLMRQPYERKIGQQYFRAIYLYVNIALLTCFHTRGKTTLLKGCRDQGGGRGADIFKKFKQFFFQ
jgi:hypothetical protein